MGDEGRGLADAVRRREEDAGGQTRLIQRAVAAALDLLLGQASRRARQGSVHEGHGRADGSQGQGGHAGLAAQRETQARDNRHRARHTGRDSQLLIRERLQADRVGRLVNEGTNARGALHVETRMHEGINPIGDERGGEQGTGNNAQQIHPPIVRHLCPRGKPNGPATPKQRDESGATHS